MSRNHRLVVQRLVSGNPLAGEPVERYVDVTPVWASIEPTGGVEFQRAGQMQATASHKITTELVPTASRSMRLISPDPTNDCTPLRVFNVESVMNVEERNRASLWMCNEAV
jgi:head-tail adaptor